MSEKSVSDDAMSDDPMTDEEKRRDQLTAAPDATEADAAPRIDVTKRGSVTRIDVRDDAAVRPGRTEESEDDRAQ